MSIENGPILQILTYSDLLSFGISSSASSADDVAAFSSVFWPHSNQIIPIGQSNERSASESELAAPRSRPLDPSGPFIASSSPSAAECGVHYVTAAQAQAREMP